MIVFVVMLWLCLCNSCVVAVLWLFCGFVFFELWLWLGCRVSYCCDCCYVVIVLLVCSYGVVVMWLWLFVQWLCCGCVLVVLWFCRF